VFGVVDSHADKNTLQLEPFVASSEPFVSGVSKTIDHDTASF
jgi:hypothetical protein